MAESQEQMIGTGSVDSDLGTEPGPQLITEEEVAAEVGRRDEPRPIKQPKGEVVQDDKLAKDLQKVQQEQSARRQLQEKLEGKVDNLADMFERFMSSSRNEPAPESESNALSEFSDVEPSKIVQEAFEDVDMLDADSVQQAMSKIAGSMQGDSSLRNELNALRQQVADIGGHIQKGKNDQYWTDFMSQHGLSQSDLDSMKESAHTEVADTGWYQRGSEGYDGALHSNILAQAKARSGKHSSGSSIPATRVPTEGTDIVPQGASARTGIPLSGNDGIELTPPEALWRPDND